MKRGRAILAGLAGTLSACGALLGIPDRELDPELGADGASGRTDATTSGDRMAAGDSPSPDAAVDAPPCEAGLAYCGDAGCVNLGASALHCGACGIDCLGGGCEAGACLPIVVRSGLDGPIGLAVTADAIFVVENGGDRVTRIDKADGGIGDAGLAATFTAPWGLGIEDAGAASRLVVGETRGGGMARVYACTATSCGATTSIASGADSVHYFAVANGAAYWGEATGGQRIRTCQLSDCGGTTVNLRTSGENDAWGMLVVGSTLYWTRRDGTSSTVRSCDLDAGCAAVTTVASGRDDWEGITGDGTRLWWADNGDGRILTCARAACDAGTFATTGSPRFVLLDDGKVFWTSSSSSGSIEWCPASGCDAGAEGGSGPRVLASAQSSPRWIAVDPQAIYWTNNGSGQVVKIRRPR